MSTETVLTALISAGIFLMWIPACYIADKLMKPKKRRKSSQPTASRTESTNEKYHCYCN